MAGATRSYELARRLVQRGHEVQMVTTDRSDAKTDGNSCRVTNEDGIVVHWITVPYDNTMSFSRRVKAFFAFAFYAARKAASLGGDVVFATSTPLTVAIPAVYAKKKNKIPMVFEVRDLWPAVPIALGVLRNPIAKWLARRLERYAYKNSTRIVALAPGMKVEVAALGFPADRITVIPNGCDIELFDRDKSETDELRNNYEWLGQRPLIAYIGTMGRINAVDYLVQISRRMLEIDDQVRFVVIGSGVEEENVRELAQQLGVYEKNFFMLGRKAKKDAALWCRSATVNVALVTGPRFIWKDATQNKYFDSLAAGRPVASNYDGWQALIAQEAGAGLIIDANDSRKAAKQLLVSVRDEAWLADASKQAMTLATEQFSRDQHALDLENVLAQACRDT